jgi:hypothetical protein
MKWYQHLVDSEDDPDIMEAIEIFGHHGYYVFFRTLSIVGREFNVETPGYICMNFAVFSKKFQKVSQKKLQKILKNFQKNRRIFTKVFKKDGVEFIHINVPKFRNLLSDNAMRKIREYKKKTGFKSESKRLKDKEKEKDKDKQKGKEQKGGGKKGEKKTNPPSQKAGGDSFLNFDFSRWPNLNHEAWKEFEEHRVEIKKPLTDKARVIACNFLLKQSSGNHAIQKAIIDKTIMNRWQGLFELDEKELKSAEQSARPKLFKEDEISQEDVDAANAAAQADADRHEEDRNRFEQEMAGLTPEEREAKICEMKSMKARLMSRLNNRS